jgi:hypothetical protein
VDSHPPRDLKLSDGEMDPEDDQNLYGGGDPDSVKGSRQKIWLKRRVD